MKKFLSFFLVLIIRYYIAVINICNVLIIMWFIDRIIVKRYRIRKLLNKEKHCYKRRMEQSTNVTVSSVPIKDSSKSRILTSESFATCNRKQYSFPLLVVSLNLLMITASYGWYENCMMHEYLFRNWYISIIISISFKSIRSKIFPLVNKIKISC